MQFKNIEVQEMQWYTLLHKEKQIADETSWDSCKSHWCNWFNGTAKAYYIQN